MIDKEICIHIYMIMHFHKLKLERRYNNLKMEEIDWQILDMGKRWIKKDH